MESHYYGYEPKSPQDYSFEEDDDAFGKTAEKAVDPLMLRDNLRTSTISIISMGFAALTLLILVIWFFMIGGVGDCKVKRLCDIRDRSSYLTSRSAPKNYEFLVPTKFVWLGMTMGTLCLLVATVFAFSILRKSTGSTGMAETAGRIQTASFRIVSKELLFMLLPILLAFILIGFGPGWRLSGAYFLGAIVTVITSYSAVWVSTSGSVRTAAATREGSRDGMKAGFRSGMTIGLVMGSTAIIGVSSVYLMFEDVRSLGAFTAGASTVALFSIVYGGIFAHAANLEETKAITYIGAPQANTWYPRSIARLLSDNVSGIFGGNADCFVSLVGSIAAAAILGSYLPYFYRDPFAMCVFNHLYVDEKCGPFGYPSKLSYASYICKANDYYLQYPRLSVWQSTTLFVALPFMVAAVGVLASVVAAFLVRFPAQQTEEEYTEDESKKARKLLWSVRVNRLITAVIVLGGLFALFFILFGPSSEFQKGVGLSANQNLPFFRLAEDPDACVNAFLKPEPGADYSAAIYPMGTFSREGRYSPLSTLGSKFGESHQIYWRLFLCACLGVGLGQLIYFLTEHFTDESYSRVQRIAAAKSYGAGAPIQDGLCSGMLSNAISTFVVMFTIFWAFKVFGFYGVAISSVAMLSTLGITMSGLSYGPIMNNAVKIAELSRPRLKKEIYENAFALQKLGRLSVASSKAFATSSSVLAAYSIVAAFVHESEIAPSPRSVAGSPRILGRVLLNSSSMVDIYVVASCLIGLVLPFFVVGQLAISHSRACHLGFTQRREEEDVTFDDDDQTDASFVDSFSGYALLESVLPTLSVIMPPLIIGFGFGQRALLGMLVFSIGSGYEIASTISNAAGAWKNANEIGLSPDSRRNLVSVTGLIDVPFQDSVGPALNVYMKMTGAIALITAPLMEPDRKNGWIGAVLLAVTAIFFSVYRVWSIRHSRKSARDLTEEEITTAGVVLPPPKKVSPFYVEHPTWNRIEVFPGSQMADAIGDEQNNIRFNPATLPGLSDRDELDMTNISLDP